MTVSAFYAWLKVRVGCIVIHFLISLSS